MIQIACLMALALLLSGCNQMKAVAQSRQEKLAEAFPLADELLTAPGMLFAALEGDPRLKPVREQYAQLLEARSTKCGGSAIVGRFETPDDIRQKIGDASCFDAFDRILVDWVGVKRVSLELARPALVPVAVLPSSAVLPPQLGPADRVTIAQGANVAVLKGNEGKLTGIELPSGRVLGTVTVPPFGEAAMALSPNGRVVAIRGASNKLAMLDVVSGKTLWATPSFSSVLGWIPDVGAVVLARAQGGGSALMDFRAGTLSSYSTPVAQPTWTVQGTDQAGRLLIGNHTDVAIMDHARRGDGGIDVTKAKHFQLPPDRFIRPESFLSSGAPFLMSQGKKLAYMHRRDWAWLDLDSGQGAKWNTEALGTIAMSKISDTLIYLATTGGRASNPPLVLNIEQGTLVGVKSPSPVSGILHPATPRLGYILHTNGAIVIGNNIEPEGEPRPIEQVVSQMEEAQQVATIQNPGPQEEVKRTPWPDGQAAVSTNPPIPGVPANAHVSAIGVYRPVAKGKGSMPGKIDIKLAPGKTPLVLILTNYEQVQWNILPSDRPIAAIILSTYEGSKVTGYEGNVVLIGRETSYKPGTPEYKKLKTAVAHYVPMPIRLFQGANSGWEFLVPAD